MRCHRETLFHYLQYVIARTNGLEVRTTFDHWQFPSFTNAEGFDSYTSPAIKSGDIWTVAASTSGSICRSLTNLLASVLQFYFEVVRADN